MTKAVQAAPAGEKPADYLHVWAWGKLMQSMDYYITMQQQQAAEDKAPIDAIYKQGDEWRTFGQVKNEFSKAKIETLLATRRGLAG